MNKMMSSIISSTEMIIAKVESVDGTNYILKNRQIPFKAKKAVSCLVEPSLGDKVMVCGDMEEKYIISVLESASSTTVDITTDTINLFAQKANIVIQDVSFLTKLVSLKSDTITLASNIYNGIIDTFTLKNKDFHHLVDGHKDEQMKSSRRVVKGCDIHQVDESITISNGQVKVDAPQINMG